MLKGSELLELIQLIALGFAFRSAYRKVRGRPKEDIGIVLLWAFVGSVILHAAILAIGRPLPDWLISRAVSSAKVVDANSRLNEIRLLCLGVNSLLCYIAGFLCGQIAGAFDVANGELKSGAGLRVWLRTISEESRPSSKSEINTYIFFLTLLAKGQWVQVEMEEFNLMGFISKWDQDSEKLDYATIDKSYIILSDVKAVDKVTGAVDASVFGTDVLIRADKIVAIRILPSNDAEPASTKRSIWFWLTIIVVIVAAIGWTTIHKS